MLMTIIMTMIMIVIITIIIVMSLPIHDGSCMGAGVMAIWGEAPPRVKEVDAGPEVAVARVCRHDPKLLPEDVRYRHVCKHATASVRGR